MSITYPTHRPIVFLDTESTGIDTENDRIVMLTLLRFEPPTAQDPGGSQWRATWLINPQFPIPAEATEVHGITDADVAGKPKFAELAEDLFDRLAGCDYGGFNVIGFDLPLLEAEFARCGIRFEWQDASIADGYAIMCQQEPRSLEGALRFYCGEQLEGAHTTDADVDAAIRVIAAQAERYGIEPFPESLDAAGRREDWADRSGRIRMRADGALVFGFGKHAGHELAAHRDYCEWILRKDFPSDTKRIIRAALPSEAIASRQ